MRVCPKCNKVHTMQNVCACAGHDSRYRLLVGPMPEGVRRPSVLTCLDCKEVWRK